MSCDVRALPRQRHVDVAVARAVAVVRETSDEVDADQAFAKLAIPRSGDITGKSSAAMRDASCVAWSMLFAIQPPTGITGF